MKIRFSIFGRWISLFFFFLLPTVAFANAKTKEAFLMVQSAATAEIMPVNEQDTYKVVLKNVSPFVAYFSERPNREAGSMSIDKFLLLWEKKNKNGFKDNPPNADLHAMQTAPGDEAVNFAIELTTPVYDSEKQTLSYIVRPLKGTEFPRNVSEMHHILLFIDDVCLSCW